MGVPLGPAYEREGERERLILLSKRYAPHTMGFAVRMSCMAMACPLRREWFRACWSQPALKQERQMYIPSSYICNGIQLVVIEISLNLAGKALSAFFSVNRRRYRWGFELKLIPMNAV